MQYATPFTCPDCEEHTFETEIAPLLSEEDLVGATCTNCGHELEQAEVDSQAEMLPTFAIPKMIADAEALTRRFAGH